MESLPSVLGEDPVFLEVVEEVSRLASIDRPVLVVGERGTGKELLTSRLHFLSRRWDGPLVKINCAALAESLLESELFGHEAGAFTGAQRRHPGHFERAHGGTLVLDEIATASAAVQEKVLRIIEYGEFERVGGRDTIQVDVRVVGATNVDLPTLAEDGLFRADLLDRLAFEVVTVPPLRARPADIRTLAQEFGLDMARQLGRAMFPGFSSDAQRQLRAYHWPGNVRELKNVVERAVCRAADPEQPIEGVTLDPFDSPWRPNAEARVSPVSSAGASTRTTPSHLSQAEVQSGLEDGFAAQVTRYERQLLTDALQHVQYNQTKAAQALGLSYHQLRRQIDKHGLRASGAKDPTAP